jgi:nitrite reductase (NO-forming)
VRMKFWTYLFTLAWLFTAAGCAGQVSQAKSETGQQVTYTLQTVIQDGKMLYVGMGGEIDGQINPDLHARPGDTITIILVNGDGIPHDVAFEVLGVQSKLVSRKEQSTSVTLTAKSSGTYVYYCAVSGHRQAGMEGKLVIADAN